MKELLFMSLGLFVWLGIIILTFAFFTNYFTILGTRELDGIGTCLLILIRLSGIVMDIKDRLGIIVGKE